MEGIFSTFIFCCHEGGNYEEGQISSSRMLCRQTKIRRSLCGVILLTMPLATPPATTTAPAGTLPGSYDYLGQKVKVKYYDIYVDKATGQLAIFQKSTGNLVVITDYFI